MSFYRRTLPHIQKDYVPHFVTFVTKKRRILPDWARTIVLESCMHGHTKKYNLYVAAVMPDHVHLILTPLIDFERRRIYPLYQILGQIKALSDLLEPGWQECMQSWHPNSPTISLHGRMILPAKAHLQC